MKKTKMSSRKRRQEARKKLVLGGVAVGVVLTVCLITYGVLSSSVNKIPKDTILDNVYIADVNVSGMKAKEAKKALEKREAELQQMKISLIAEEVTAEMAMKDLGFHIEKTDELVKKAVAYGKDGGVWKRYSLMKDLEEEEKVFSMTYAVDTEIVEKTIEEKIPNLKNGAKDATIKREGGKFVITDETKGVTIDVKESQKTIQNYINKEWKKKDGESIKLVTKVEEPKITRKQLEEIQDVLGTFTTNCGTGGGRVQNIVTGAGHINGTLLMPGEEYSANGAMEPYTYENGYAEAGSYENGKVVQSMGGGICQVSSTLYNAVILAELEIVERAAHSMLVSYVEPSMDAAIAGDFKDLKFKNNQETPIYIEGYVSGGYITFNIYGKETRPASRTIKYVSEVVESTPAGKKFQESGDAIGTIKKASSGYTGMKAKLWKVVYENGAEVSRDVVNNSTYRKSDAVWNVGTASDHAEAAAIVKNAIGSNDEAAINAAIAQAKALIEVANKPAATPPATTPETTTPESETNTP